MTTRRDGEQRRGGRKPANDLRYQQLLALANEGNEDAAGDLFREYGVTIPVTTETGKDAGSCGLGQTAVRAVAS